VLWLRGSGHCVLWVKGLFEWYGLMSYGGASYRSVERTYRFSSGGVRLCNELLVYLVGYAECLMGLGSQG